MKLKREISSTEKLLDLIRSKNRHPDQMDDEFVLSPGQNKKTIPSKEILFSKPVSVGVDIGKRNLKLVRINQNSAGKRDHFDYRTIPYPEKMNRDSEHFATFLGSELARFCNGFKKVNIWSVLPFDKVEIQSVNIPQVPKKQMENAIFWTAKKEMAFDEDYVFDYEVKGEIIDRGIQKTAVMAIAAPKPEMQKIKELFIAAGYPLTGLTLAPFTIQNLLMTKWVPAQDTVASIYIGWDFSRIDIFSRGSLVAVRSVKIGTNGLVEMLKEEIEKNFNVGEISLGQAENILCSLSPDYKASEWDKKIDLTEEEKFEMIKPALGRIVTQLEMTFKNYSSNIDNKTVSKIFISTAMPFYKPVVDYIGEQLGVEADVLDPIPAESSKLNSPELSLTERSQFALCLGLALSDNSRTPNLLFTYEEKKNKAVTAKFNKAIIAVCVLFIVTSLGYFSWQKHNISNKQKELSILQEKLNHFGLALDQNSMYQLIAHLKQQQQVVKEYLDRYRGTVILGEISTLTPPNVKLLSVKASLNPIATDKDKEPKRSLAIEGIVLGKKEVLEAGLADYLASLKSSPIFSQANIENKNVQNYRSESVLHFNIDLKLN